MTERRGSFGSAVFAALVFAAGTLWVLRPWFLEADSFPRAGPGVGAMGDTDLCLNVWILGWIAHAILHEPTRLFDGNIYYPASNTIAGSENMLAHLPVTAPVLALSDNALVVLKAMALESFVLAGLAMFLLVRHHTADVEAALVAGACYTFTSFRTHTLPQPQYLGSCGIPLALLAIDCWIARRRVRALAGLSAAMALQVLSCVYLGYFAFLAVPFYGVARAGGLPAGRRARNMLVLGAAMAVGAVVVVPVFLPYLQGRAVGMIPRHDIELVSNFSMWPIRYLNPLILEWTGLIPAVLAVTGVLATLHRTGGGSPSAATWVLAAAGVLWSFGPYLRVGDVRIPLPYAALFHWLPGFSAIRAPARAVLVLAAALSALAGYAVSHVWRRWPATVRRAAAWTLVAASALLAAPQPASTFPARLGRSAPAVYEWLAGQPRGGAVLEIPVTRDDNDILGNLRSSQYMVASTIHWHPILNGYTAYVPLTASFLDGVARHLPDADALAVLLANVDVRWVIVHEQDLDAREREAWTHAELRSLARVATFNGDTVYAVHRTGEPPGPLRLVERGATRQATTLDGTPIAPLPPECRRGRIISVDIPPTLFSISAATGVPVRFENQSPCAWPALEVRRDDLVGLEYAWISPSGHRYAPSTATRLLRDVPPGATVDDTLLVTPPGPESGTWTAEVILAQDGVAEPIARLRVRTDVRGTAPATPSSP